ncbi:MAG: GNAT family N-acetyltransferase [Bacilli bacterium]|jgi:PhnO protein|nr:GNAT family N-acetyltransferase [Bacilli bacterium]
MIIREANIDDLAVIYQFFIVLEGTELDYHRFKEVFQKNLNDDQIYYVIAESDNIIVGFGSVHLHLLLHHIGMVAEIEELFVKEEYRLLNIGQALINELVNIAMKEDCELIELASNKLRTKAHGFYEKCGFKATHFKFTMPLKAIKNI